MRRPLKRLLRKPPDIEDNSMGKTIVVKQIGSPIRLLDTFDIIDSQRRSVLKDQKKKNIEDLKKEKLAQKLRENLKKRKQSKLKD